MLIQDYLLNSSNNCTDNPVERKTNRYCKSNETRHQRHHKIHSTHLSHRRIVRIGICLSYLHVNNLRQIRKYREKKSNNNNTNIGMKIALDQCPGIILNGQVKETVSIIGCINEIRDVIKNTIECKQNRHLDEKLKTGSHHGNTVLIINSLGLFLHCYHRSLIFSVLILLADLRNLRLHLL